MKKLIVATLGAAVALTSLAPAAQARMRKPKAAQMMMTAPVNPRIAPNGDFYATPVMADDPSAVIFAPLGVPGAVVGGVAQPLLAPIAAPDIVLPGVDLLPH